MLAPDPQRLALRSLGPVKVAQTPLRIAEVCQGESDLQTFLPKGGPGHLQSCLEGVLCLLIKTEIKVDSREDNPQFKLHLRLVGQLVADALGSFVQNASQQFGVL